MQSRMTLPARVVLLTTYTANRAVAERIAAHLVQARLAAATHMLGPSASHFRWDSSDSPTHTTMQRVEEWGIEVVTAPDIADVAASCIADLHDYDVPSITAIEVRTTVAFADWVCDQVR